MLKKSFLGLSNPRIEYELLPVKVPEPEKVAASKTVTLFHPNNGQPSAAPAFQTGDRVRISGRVEHRHHRVPAYVKGHAGVVERVCAEQGQPELLALGDDGKPQQTLYRVHFNQQRLWDDYTGTADDSLEIEIFEHWLEPA